MKLKSDVQAKPGDPVVVHGHSTGDSRRTGVILEVLNPASGHEHYRVRWEDRVSLYWPKLRRDWSSRNGRAGAFAELVARHRSVRARAFALQHLDRAHVSSFALGAADRSRDRIGQRRRPHGHVDRVP